MRNVNVRMSRVDMPFVLFKWAVIGVLRLREKAMAEMQFALGT